MKLVCLNAWGGIQGQQFFDFISESAKDTDIFCFQEVYDSINPPTLWSDTNEHYNLKNELKDLLPNYRCYFRENIYNANMQGGVDFELRYGLCTFIHKKHDDIVFDEGDVMVFGSKRKGYPTTEPTARNIQYLRMKIDGETLNILNLHGIWIKDYGKGDHPHRILQSQNVFNFIQNLDGYNILVGDFNLLPDTESIALLENTGMENLIKTHNIQSTRSDLYTKPAKYADYVLISGGIRVNNFTVPYVEASDHLPMCLDFEMV
jgi:endonuclease/exonuclease/phosphatase family metal-dependent hydrolase